MADEIHVRNWDRFQHPDVARNKHGSIPWIRTYTELLSDPAYTSLSGHRRAVLHGLWLEYARSRRRLTDDTRTLTRRLDLKVTRADLASLNHAGFITLVASESQADAAHVHTREEKREEKRQPLHQPQPNNELDVTDTDKPVLQAPRGLELNGRNWTADDLLQHIKAQQAQEDDDDDLPHRSYGE